MKNKILDNYFLLLFSIIPLTIIIGPAISLGTILLIDFSFILFFVYKNEYKFFLNKTVKLILLLCLYLIFNSLIAKDFSISAFRNLGFIRFGILFLAFNYFFLNSNFYKKILVIWTLTLFILVVDVYIESITGKNIFGYSDLAGPGGRIVSLFKDEQIIGGYMTGFFLIIIGYLSFLNKKLSNKYKNLILLFAILFFVFGIHVSTDDSIQYPPPYFVFPYTAALQTYNGIGQHQTLHVLPLDCKDLSISWQNYETQAIELIK